MGPDSDTSCLGKKKKQKNISGPLESVHYFNSSSIKPINVRSG